MPRLCSASAGACHTLALKHRVFRGNACSAAPQRILRYASADTYMCRSLPLPPSGQRSLTIHSVASVLVNSKIAS